MVTKLQCCCGKDATTGRCEGCDREVQENFEYQATEWASKLGAIWNVLFPDERDDWEYPGQMFRCVLAQVVAMREELLALDKELPKGTQTVYNKSYDAPLVDAEPYVWKPEE